MLDETFKAEWIAALESEEYTQGHNRLWEQSAPGKTMCCLGVAGDLLVKAGKAQWDGGTLVDPNASQEAVDEGHSSSSGYLPRSLCTLIGLSAQHGDELARTNDQSVSFAPVIERIWGL